MSAYLPAVISSTITRLSRVKNKTEEKNRQRLADLKAGIEYTKNEIDNAMNNFDNVLEPRLLDYYIYKIQSERSRYDQLLAEYKVVKENI